MDYVSLKRAHHAWDVVRAYFVATKPGIVAGNLLTAMAGFYLEPRHGINLVLLLQMVGGLACIIAAASVFNNIIDRAADAKMERTKHRPLATGQITVTAALWYATLLFLGGIAMLLVTVGLAAALLATLGLLIYVLPYSLWKYHSPKATVVGSIAGALPPLIGYSSAGQGPDIPGWLFFWTLFLWQMPHFFSIALYRAEDYAKAAIPTFVSRYGVHATKRKTLLYLVAFTLSLALLKLELAPLGLLWFVFSLYGQDKRWARRVFFLSLIVVAALCLAIIFIK